MNACIASFYIIIGTFDSLVTFIGTVPTHLLAAPPKRKPNTLCINTKPQARHIRIHILPPCRPRNLHPPPLRKRPSYQSPLQDPDLQSHHLLPL